MISVDAFIVPLNRYNCNMYSVIKLLCYQSNYFFIITKVAVGLVACTSKEKFNFFQCFICQRKPKLRVNAFDP